MTDPCEPVKHSSRSDCSKHAGDEDEDGSEDEGEDAPDLLPVAIPKTLAGDAIQTVNCNQPNLQSGPFC